MLLAFAYRYIRSFGREDGGLYAAYVWVNSRVYSARMKWLHNRGRHSKNSMGSNRCTWCGECR